MATHEHAVEVDTALASLWEEAFDLRRTLGWKTDALHTANGERRGRHPRTWQDLPWETDLDETVAQVGAKASLFRTGAEPAHDADWATVRGPWYESRKASEALDAYQTALRAVQANLRAQRPLEEEYDAHRWSRFFLVTNANGHIHSSMGCSTCRWDTQYAWLPTLSGLTETDAVEQQGPRLCSVCYPTAPVEWTLGLPKPVDPTVCTGSGLPAVIVERQGTRWNRNTFRDEPITYNAKACQTCGRTDLTFRGEMLSASKHKTPKAKAA